jgi:tRNA(Ile)-lysidine synthase
MLMSAIMRTPLEQQVLENIGRLEMVSPGDRVGVAVSGGADSVALLRICEALRNELGITLRVVHFDHSLRGAESQADAEFVAKVARGSGLEFVSAREDVAAEAERRGWNLEDAARRMRYAFFARVVEEGRATRIAVAHTANDQAETLLAHLIRGTGLTGLAGIYPTVGAIVRPLLGARRKDLREYLRKRGDEWREDATNRDVRRLRARIREQLLPVLERDFSPAVVGHLSDLARFAREEEVFWTALVEDRFQAHVREDRKSLAIDVSHLLAPLQLTSIAAEGEVSDATSPLRTLTERLIRRLYEGARGDRRELSARHVEQVIRLAEESTSGRRAELPGGIAVERNFDTLFFSRPEAARDSRSTKETSQSRNAYQYVMSLPGQGAATVSVPELGRRFSLKVIDWPVNARETKSAGVTLDAALLRTPLILRNWRPGDAYRPRGRRQLRKLKQMFLAGRVPSRERASWPVLESDGKVIWARGMPPAAEFGAGEGTRVGVVIEEDNL